MRTKIISLVILLIVLAKVLFAVSKMTQQNVAVDSPVVVREFCSPTVVKLATSTGETYVNTVLGFSFFLPEGWRVPSSTDNDPHFYNCDTRDGFEISGGLAGEGFYKAVESEYLKPKDSETIEIYDKLIPGAIVRLYRVKDVDQAPWGYTHDILFSKEKRALILISKQYADQREFLKTFKLLKPAEKQPTNPVAPPIASTLKIVSPNGGEIVQKGVTSTITYDTGNMVGKQLRIRLINEETTEVWEVAGTDSAKVGIEKTFLIVPPVAPSGSKYKIGIKECEGTGGCVIGANYLDLSDDYFSIK